MTRTTSPIHSCLSNTKKCVKSNRALCCCVTTVFAIGGLIGFSIYALASGTAAALLPINNTTTSNTPTTHFTTTPPTTHSSSPTTHFPQGNSYFFLDRADGGNVGDQLTIEKLFQPPYQVVENKKFKTKQPKCKIANKITDKAKDSQYKFSYKNKQKTSHEVTNPYDPTSNFRIKFDNTKQQIIIEETRRVWPK